VGLAQRQMKTSAKRWSVLLVAVVVLYVGAYGGLRCAHIVTHYSNADHWHPEKRSPGHFVDTGTDGSLDSELIRVLFFPLMCAERAYHEFAG